MLIRVAVGVLVFAGFFAVRSAGAANVSTKSVLDDLRKAMLSRPLASISSLHGFGTLDVVGIRGRMQEWDDLRGVRFTLDQAAGPLSGASGWDGRSAWNQDYAGLVTIDGGTVGRKQAIDQAYVDNLRFLRPDAGGATVVYAGRRSANNASYDVLAVSPPQGGQLEFWIDPQTHLIAQLNETIGIFSATTRYSNFRHVDGITYPFDSTTQTSSGNSSSARLSSLAINESVTERIRVPSQNVHDFAISGGPSTTIPLQIVNNHVYLSDVMLDGHGPFTFVLDSGGDYIVTPEVAAQLHAKSAGGLQLQGVGSATEGASFTRVESIAAGSAIVRNQYMLVLPIATGFGVAEGMRIDGMVGHQFLARFLTTIDYAGSMLTLAMPSAAPAMPPGGAALHFFFDGTIPRIPVTVYGVPTTAEVDTGNRAGLELSSPFLATYPAIAALAKTQPSVVGFGVGGPAYARLGRIPSLLIGPYEITNTITSFTYQTKGAFADPYNPVNVGGAIWRRFTVTFDYPHSQILLAKNSQFDTPPPFDRSGLFLIDANGAYTVLSVLPGTPSAAAGMKKDDVILTINGAATTTVSLAGVRAALSAASGTQVHLHIRGPAGHERDVTLTLADYV